jgi:KDO2-lipid IV(A) lauroyltransferase
MQKLAHYLEYTAFVIVGSIVRLFPPTKVHHVGITVGRLCYPLFPSRRRVALRNLRNAYPDMPADEIERIAKLSFQQMSAAVVELLAVPSFTADDVRRLITIENKELLERAGALNRGVVFLTAHFGNWELAADALSVHMPKPCYVIAKKQSNALVDRDITKWRRKFGSTVIPMNAIREVLKTLQEGHTVLMAADQAASTESISVEFFGRMVPTYAGPAVFALRTRSPLVLGLAHVQPDGTYRMRLHEISYQDLSEYTDANVLELTRRQVQLTETLIREHPEQWMWTHKRWKHVADRPGISIPE